MNSTSGTNLQSWIGTGSINIFGRPFAGKDTQAAKLAQLFGGIVLGGGDILRNSTIPEHVSAALKRGELIPSQDYVDIVLPYLAKPDFSLNPLILSSVGRWKGEEEGVIQALTASNHPLRAVVHLEVSEATVRARWNSLSDHDDRGGRHDDTLEILERRLEEYRSKTLPVLDAYKDKMLLISVNGEQSKKNVEAEIIRRLSEFAER